MRALALVLTLALAAPLVAGGENPADPMYTDTTSYANQARFAAQSGVAVAVTHALQIGVDGSNAARLGVRCFIASSGDPETDIDCALGYVGPYPEAAQHHAYAVADVPAYVADRETVLLMGFKDNATAWPDHVLGMVPLP